MVPARRTVDVREIERQQQRLIFTCLQKPPLPPEVEFLSYDPMKREYEVRWEDGSLERIKEVTLHNLYLVSIPRTMPCRKAYRRAW